MIPYNRHNLFPQDKTLIKNLLNGNFLTQGPLVDKFENIIKNYVNSKYAVATTNASTALHCACASLNIKKSDIVWFSNITFISSASCAFHFTKKVNFLDIDLNTFNIDVDNLEKKLIEANKKKAVPKLIIVTHLGGNPCDMKKIYILKKKYKFKLIEDGSHALGSKIGNSYIGSCKYSDFTIFSFHPLKNITSFEGGIITTNNLNYKNQILKLREHGIVRYKDKKKGLNWKYNISSIGYNFRMSEIHAVLGLSQFKNLNNIVKKRNEVAEVYVKYLKKNKNLILQKKLGFSAYHLFIILFKKKISLKKKSQIFKFFINRNIMLQSHYIPLDKHRLTKKIIGKQKIFNCKKSEFYFSNAISIPLYFSIKKSEILKVVKSLNLVLSQL